MSPEESSYGVLLLSALAASKAYGRRTNADEARFVVFMTAAFLFFVALLQFTIRKRTMKPTIKTTTAMGFVVIVFGMLFARYSHLAFPHLHGRSTTGFLH